MTEEVTTETETSVETEAPETGTTDTGSLLTGDNAPKADTDPAKADESWKDALPPELKASKVLSSVKSLEDLVKSYEHAQSLVGKKVEDLDPEQLKAISAKLGVPDSPDGYDLGKDAPETEMTDWFKKTAVDAKIPKTAAEQLFNKYIEFEQEQIQKNEVAAQVQNEQWVADIKKEFGPAFEERLGIANRAIQEFGGEEFGQVLIDAGLGNHPVVIKALANAGKQFQEGSYKGQSTPSGPMTPTEAATKIATLMSDPDIKKHYSNPNSPRYIEVRKQIADLYKVQAQG